MAEKGGNGFKGGKPSLKSPASLKGKDDSSAKSKRGRKVKFDSEEAKTNIPSNTGGKFDFLNAKGDWGKGGKGDKIVNGGKSPVTPVTKELAPLELRVEQELPKNAKCLMDCEAAHILQGIQEQMVMLSEDPTIKLPLSFDKGLQYARSTSHYTNSQSVRQVLDALKKHGVSDGEMCMIANTCPESVDEGFALVPSLKGKKSKVKEPLKDALSELAKLKDST
ncbi:DNA-directed RNA polymerases IV and V subunit 4-like [Cornus florida]|uniref:DNA-directed RNA polymerases IV and V subunit 4-like n=1 Tax=Cornus florida TaxID=4283 RepID=UPI00289BBBE9|nr:DNA-directed RNA polymerases IV and V subunit 4-like [Cornus florida]